MSARLIAFECLDDILFRKKSMDEAFVRAQGFDDLSARDKGFTRLLVTTVLKRAQQLDAALKEKLRDPLERLKPPQLVNVFRLGLAQLAFLQTKPHAAVDTTVALAEEAGITHHKPLVNAVMRRFAATEFPPMDERDAGRLNTPEWLWHEWMQDYGVETALDIAAANLGEAPVDFSVKSDAAQWAEKLGAQLLPTGSLRRADAGFVPALEGFAEGAWWVQNAAAALPVKFLGDVQGKTVVDLCGAPGGKTAQLAAGGARVIAVDRSSQRLARLEENMTRLGYNVETIAADGAQFQPQEKVDAVLLDAPCTATGTLRHQPDVAWLKDLRDQEKLVAAQRRLLQNAVAMLKSGGALVYCTCSLQKAESEAQTDWLLAQNLPVRLSPITMEIPEIITPRGEMRALPQHWKDLGGIDGFYAACFVRD